MSPKPPQSCQNLVMLIYRRSFEILVQQSRDHPVLLSTEAFPSDSGTAYEVSGVVGMLPVDFRCLSDDISPTISSDTMSELTALIMNPRHAVVQVARGTQIIPEGPT